MTFASWPIHVPDGVLDDLRRRLDRVRFPDELSDIGWDDGTPLAYVRELVEYWRGGYDWRAQERMLNERLPSFRAEIDGLGVHFAHIPGVGPDPFPLLLIHGWPGSYFEMYKIAGPLADPAAHGGDPADAFHVVVPSIPGHGFSDAPREPGFNADRAADVFRDLMVETLGYPRFGAQGGDRGAFVSAGLGSRHPANVVGIHLNMGLAIPSPEAERGPEERAWLERQAAWRAAEGGYMGIQSTKPADAGLWPERLTGGAGRVDRGEVARVERLRRRRRAPLHQGRAAHQRHDLLGDRHHPLVGALLLRAPVAASGGGASRRHRYTRGGGPLSRGCLPAAPRRRRAQVPRPPALHRVRPGRSLRLDGGAGTAHRGRPRLLPAPPLRLAARRRGPQQV